MKIEDIAKEAGVSKGTVSKVINEYPNISEKLKNKVNEIIKKNNFVPNNSARNLAGKKNKVLGLFIYDKGELKTSAFFQTFVGIAVDEAEKKGYSVLVSIIKSNETFEKVKHFYDSSIINGAIIIGMTRNIKELDELINRNYKIALIDYSDISLNKNTILINSNNYLGGELAAKHLVQKGCKNLLHISGDFDKFAGKKRAEGFENFCLNNNINYKILEASFNGFISKGIFKKYFEETENISDGIFCANDETAINIINFLDEIGIKPGFFLKIIGFDNIDLSTYISPKLTTIDVDLRTMAIQTINFLIKKIEEKDNNNIYKYESKIELIERES
ncbi:MAG: LacI family DNA-binding transcriptional regulator [Fusobacteriaceae bacterium]